MEYYSVIKKRIKNFPFAATWVDLDGTLLKEISHTERDKYCMTSLMCETLKITTNEYI